MVKKFAWLIKNDKVSNLLPKQWKNGKTCVRNCLSRMQRIKNSNTLSYGQDWFWIFRSICRSEQSPDRFILGLENSPKLYHGFRCYLSFKHNFKWPLSIVPWLWEIFKWFRCSVYKKMCLNAILDRLKKVFKNSPSHHEFWKSARPDIVHARTPRFFYIIVQ